MFHRTTVLCLSRDTFPGKRIRRQSINQSVNQSVRGGIGGFIKLLDDLLMNRVCIGDDSGQWRTQEFCSGRGVQQIQLRTEDRENGDLGAVAH